LLVFSIMLRGMRSHPFYQRASNRTTGGLASLRVLVALGAFLAAPRVCALAGEWHPPAPLNVAVYDLPPYGAMEPDGEMSGISVDLWRRVAEKLQWDYKLTPVSHIESILSGLEQGRFDAAIGAITITPEREAHVDFSYPAHRSGVAVALPKETGPLAAVLSYWRVAADLGSLIVGILALLVLLGIIIWLIERPGLLGRQAREDSIATLRDGLYWAVVTTTTVGYGDKTPKTHLGRFVAVVWMLGSLVLVSMFTASMISRLTAEHLETGGIRTESDLRGKKLAAVAESSGAEYLDRLHLKYEKFDNLVEALSSLADGRSNAVVNSEGTLRYLVSTRFRENIRVPRILLAPAYMAIALPEHSRLKRPIDRALINITASPEWKAVEERYFGQ
jgi:polar amino acid transport system substrate-binding protein